MKKILLYGLEKEKTEITEKVAREYEIEINKISEKELEKKLANSLI
ncbi:hypothetical protein [Peptoniphilus porci]|nr:hypothetical protein [Peptoniphilus porci]